MAAAERGTPVIGKLAVLVLVAAVLAAQPAPQRAGLVVQYADGTVETHCVRFSEPQITGLALLERAEVPIVTQGSPLGAAVCKIGPDGCAFPSEPCFCAQDGMRAVYWALHVRDGDAWTYANLGAANVAVTDGTIHGWAWGTGDSSVGAQPPLIDLATICGPLAEAPTAMPTATLTPAPAPTPEPAPTAEPPAAPAASTPGAPPMLWVALFLIAALAAGLVVVRRRR
jgi:hypothetical protein